jgi:mannose-1-phosphate guanylyltransferase
MNHHSSKPLVSALEFTKRKTHWLHWALNPTGRIPVYGYIQFREDGSPDMLHIRPVKTFTEKPNEEMAKFFIRSGDFLWNSGIFIWNAKAILQAFDEHLPEGSRTF